MYSCFYVCSVFTVFFLYLIGCLMFLIFVYLHCSCYVYRLQCGSSFKRLAPGIQIARHTGWVSRKEFSNTSRSFWICVISKLIRFSMQIAISNPNREVLLTLSRSGVVEMIGKEWYFVRVHDALQVCLQHVQSLKETPNTAGSVVEDRPSLFRRLQERRADDSSISQLESGGRTQPISIDSDPQLEPLLSRKSWNKLETFTTALLPIF